MHKYLTDIEYDNKYITRYYQKIDARRKRVGKHTLLPLKNTEKGKMIDLRSYRLMNREFDYLVSVNHSKLLQTLVSLANPANTVYYEYCCWKLYNFKKSRIYCYIHIIIRTKRPSLIVLKILYTKILDVF